MFALQPQVLLRVHPGQRAAEPQESAGGRVEGDQDTPVQTELLQRVLHPRPAHRQGQGEPGQRDHGQQFPGADQEENHHGKH